MRAIWKGALSFGLVNVPVRLYPAVEPKDIHFRSLHDRCHTPLRYQKFCPTCERPVEAEEVVRGYEVEPGQYVLLTEEDLAALPLPTAHTIAISEFISLSEIDPLYFERSYYLEPVEGGQRAYALLRQAMAETGRVALARVALRNREALAAVRVYQEALVLVTLYYPDEIRSPEQLVGLRPAQPLEEKELQLATALINHLAAGFAPEKYSDHYRVALAELIARKAAGLRVEPAVPPPTAQLMDLLEALKASLQAPGPGQDDSQRPEVEAGTKTGTTPRARTRVQGVKPGAKIEVKGRKGGR